MTAATMRAKLKLDSITQHSWGGEELKFSAVLSAENNSEVTAFSGGTPHADLTMMVTNKNLHGKFKPGQKVYLDFTPAP